MVFLSLTKLAKPTSQKVATDRHTYRFDQYRLTGSAPLSFHSLLNYQDTGLVPVHICPSVPMCLVLSCLFLSSPLARSVIAGTLMTPVIDQRDIHPLH